MGVGPDVRDLKNPPARLLDQARVRDGAFDIGMFRSYWERAAKVTGERIADLTTRPVPPSAEVAEVTEVVEVNVVVEAVEVEITPRGTEPPEGSEERSALAGLITRSLESANQLAAATRRRKGTKVASEPDATEPTSE